LPKPAGCNLRTPDQ
jgi:hypothetical protein